MPGTPDGALRRPPNYPEAMALTSSREQVHVGRVESAAASLRTDVSVGRQVSLALEASPIPSAGGQSAPSIRGTQDDLALTQPARPTGRGPIRAVAREPSRESHAHLWTLQDGTGLHAPPEILVRHAETGEVCCHLCGRWFRALGSHVRVHGYTAQEYRAVLGLCRTRPLSAPDMSAAISRRQQAAYQRSAAMQARLSVGHGLAKTGVLADSALAANRRLRPEADAARRRALAAGRATRASRRDAELNVLLARAGAASIGEFVRDLYEGGASLDTLARTTGFGRATLRRVMEQAGIVIRPTGINTPTGKRARAARGDALAAAQLGTDDLVGWLADRRRSGSTLSELALVVGHSHQWVRSRLERANT